MAANLPSSSWQAGGGGGGGGGAGGSASNNGHLYYNLADQPRLALAHTASSMTGVTAANKAPMHLPRSPHQQLRTLSEVQYSLE